MKSGKEVVARKENILQRVKKNENQDKNDEIRKENIRQGIKKKKIRKRRRSQERKTYTKE